MIRKVHISFLIMIIIGLGAGCSKDDDGSKGGENPQSRLVVDKIYNYENQLLAEYFYNESHQLVKRSVYDPVTYPGLIVTDNEFEYENNRISNIRNIIYTHPDFSHNIILLYDSNGKIIGDETYQFGYRTGRRDYIYQANGKIKSFVSLGEIENFFVNYKNTDNAMEIKVLVEDGDGNVANRNTTEGYREIYGNYIFDNKPKPDFGIADVFQFEPMPSYGEEAMFAKNISKNNLIESVGGTQWIHTYNENGLPATIEVKWKDIITEKPILFRIVYKEIN